MSFTLSSEILACVSEAMLRASTHDASTAKQIETLLFLQVSIDCSDQIAVLVMERKAETTSSIPWTTKA